MLYDSEYMQTTLASPLSNNHMSLTHLKGLPAGALKLGQDHTQTWIGVPIRSNNHTNTGNKTGLGYDNQVFNSQVFDCDELNSSESDDNVPTSPVHDRYKSGEGYHVVPLLYTGTFMPPKPDLVFNDVPNASKTILDVVNVESSLTKPSKDLSKTLRPAAPIIEDWTSDFEDESKIVSVPKQKK
nr:hypothetical protein [Tanacetum cinerariifolium]